MTRSTFAIFAACLIGPAASGQIASMRFTDVTATSGVDLTMVSGPSPSRDILDVNGGGVALFDFDNDGDLDLFIANGATIDDTESGPGSRLFANDGRGVFADVTDRCGIRLARWAMGVAVGDYDGDGYDDLYVTCFGPNVLLRNDFPAGKFRDVTATAGVGDAGWGTSAAFGDVDGDGDLDLYVVNYLEFDPKNPPSRSGKTYKGVNVMAGPHGLTPQRDVLYENKGDGTFADISESSGCRSVAPGYGLVVGMMDLDADGAMDIFVGNDSSENFLFRNLGSGPGTTCRFENVGVISGIASNIDGSAQATMGVAFADLDNNGFVDVLTTNFSSDTNTLHLNLDGTFFDDRTSQYGLGMVSRRFLSWGCGFYDFDSDGDEDLFISNGHVYPEAATHDIDSDYEQPPLLFERGDAKRFRRITDAGPVFKKRFRGRATAFGDIDGDGDVDVVMTTLNGAVRILRNDAPHAPLMVVELRQPGHNHRGYGASLELVSRHVHQRRWIQGGGSFQSFNAPIAHFGFGKRETGRMTLRVKWSNGKTTVVEDVRVNQRITVTPNGSSAVAIGVP